MAAYNYVRPINAGGTGNPAGIYNTSPGQFNSGSQGGGGSTFMQLYNNQQQGQGGGGGDGGSALMQLFQRMMQAQGGNTQQDLEQLMNRGRGGDYGTQREQYGRYRPPTMEGNGQGGWNDQGGYNYNLPNSYGANRFGGNGDFNPSGSSSDWLRDREMRDWQGTAVPRGNSNNGYDPGNQNFPGGYGGVPAGPAAYGREGGYGSAPVAPSFSGMDYGKPAVGGTPYPDPNKYRDPLKHNAPPDGSIGLPVMPSYATDGGGYGDREGMNGHRSSGRGAMTPRMNQSTYAWTRRAGGR